MPRGGTRPGAGRPPGSANRKTREIADRAAEEGITPLEVMLKDMRDKYEAGEISAAADRARDCAPYMHARLANIEATVDSDSTVHVISAEPLTIAEWAARYGGGLGTATGAAESPDRLPDP